MYECEKHSGLQGRSQIGQALFGLGARRQGLRHVNCDKLRAEIRLQLRHQIHVGTDEILLNDSTRLADKAQAAGVDVQIKIWPGMWHIFPFFAPFVPQAAQAIAEIGEAIKSQKGKKYP